MKYYENGKKVSDIKIAYIGGGSRGWAKVLLNDLAKDGDISGEVALYDIDFEAAKKNEKIGNMLSTRKDVLGKWTYTAVQTLKEALVGADFVFISILPGTFDEMESDVHMPEKYGIYQSVGDSAGPGGIVRAMRTLPIFEEMALAVKAYCPKAWVVNFTNPMSMCVRTLYKAFPEIKAFGCCHEVFGTQKLFARILKEKRGIAVDREEIKINVLGVNHFTWLDEVKYMGEDLLPMYAEYVKENPNGLEPSEEAKNWANGIYSTRELVKFTLFKNYGVVAAAGDRHLAEFCPGNWFLHDEEKVKEYGYAITPVWHRKKECQERIQGHEDMYNGKPMELYETGEEGVRQIKALLGLGDFVTNVNIPNVGQMLGGTPLRAIVETNAVFSGDSVRPVFAGELPTQANALVQRIIAEQETVVDAVLCGDYEKVFLAFCNDPNVCLTQEKAKQLFIEMLENTKAYLPKYEERMAAFLQKTK